MIHYSLECFTFQNLSGDSTAGEDLGVGNQGGERLTLLINRLFCPTLPVPGHEVLYGPPFTTTKDRSGCQLILGRTGLNLGEITPQPVKPEEEGRRENSSPPAVQANPAP